MLPPLDFVPNLLWGFFKISSFAFIYTPVRCCKCDNNLEVRLQALRKTGNIKASLISRVTKKAMLARFEFPVQTNPNLVCHDKSWYQLKPGLQVRAFPP
jgi:hypothetical protein